MRIGLIGTGRMGKAVYDVVNETEHIIAVHFNIDKPVNEKEAEQCDVLIDFSSAEAIDHNVNIALACKKPLVTGTTGWYDRLDEIKARVEKENGSFLYAANFAIGVLLFQQIAKIAAKLYGTFNNYDFAVHETHHNQKADSPSGTANRIAVSLLEVLPNKNKLQEGNPPGKISEDALHVTSTRVGAVPGTHRVFIESAEDSVELSHCAHGRNGFAIGSVRVAEWLIGRQGFFTIEDYLKDTGLKIAG